MNYEEALFPLSIFSSLLHSPKMNYEGQWKVFLKNIHCPIVTTFNLNDNKLI